MDELFKKMEGIVNRYVKHYKEDFDQDKQNISEILDRTCDVVYERYLFWIVRQNGTNLGYKSNIPISATYSYYLDDAENRYYIIDLEEQTIKYIKNPVEYLIKIKTN